MFEKKPTKIDLDQLPMQTERIHSLLQQNTEWPTPLAPDEIELAFYEKFFFSKDMEPYPVQEEAFNHIFADHNLLVMVPTGTGKTMIAKAGLMKALYSQKKAIYTTPLRALTEEKYRELCEDFGSQYVGFATGDFKINPFAPIQVMVAEIVWNMIYSGHCYHPADIIIMDEGHYFNDPSRGYVWEQSIIGLDASSQLIILSATIGNPLQFCQWSYVVRKARMELVQSNERRVPLIHKYEEKYLIEQVRELNNNNEVPAIIFTFGRKQCFEYARLLKSCRRFTTAEEQKEIIRRAEEVLIPRGISEKLLSLLTHGIGIHHAGILPSYKQLVEELTLDRLLKFVISTETIAAGINLPAKRVIFPSLRKYIRKNPRILLPAEYHQMAGRAGRPQFDTEGIAITLAPEEVVQEYRKELKEAEKSRRSFDAEKIRKRAYSRARNEAQRRNDIIWDDEIHRELVNGKAAALKSHTKITAEQILAIGLPDLEKKTLPGLALVEAEKQAIAKREAEKAARIEAKMLQKEQKEDDKQTDKPRKKGFQIGGQLAGLGALLQAAPKAPKVPEEPESPETPEDSQETSASSQTSKEPESPEAPEEPESPEAPDTSESPEASDTSESPEAPEDAQETTSLSGKPWPAHLPLKDSLSERLAKGTKLSKQDVAILPPPLISRRQHIYPSSPRYDISAIIDRLFIDEIDKRENHKLLAKITNNLKALGIIDEKGKQQRGWIIGDLRGIDGPFVYYCLMHHDLDEEQSRELVETIVDHDVIHRLLNRKLEDEKRNWMRARIREKRRDNPQVSWEDVEAEYERKHPRVRSFIEQIHDRFLKTVPHPELHNRMRFKKVWAMMDEEKMSFMDFIETHKLEEEEGNLFSYLSRVMKTAKMLYEVTHLAPFQLIEMKIRSKLGAIDGRILDMLWFREEAERWPAIRPAPKKAEQEDTEQEDTEPEDTEQEDTEQEDTEQEDTAQQLNSSTGH